MNGYLGNWFAKIWNSARAFAKSNLLFLLSDQPTEAKMEEIVFKGVIFRVAYTNPKLVRSCWKDKTGRNLHSLAAAKTHLEQGGEKVTLLMNGGIYEPGLEPSGLYVENGQQLKPLNLRTGKGNFFLKPNGVFLIRAGSGKAMVKDAADRLPSAMSLAIQSGPLLLKNGVVHPKFRRGSKNTLIRNGVGVHRDGRVVFAITGKRELCNLWTFAMLFKTLGCDNALFLDGDLSRMVEDPKDGLSKRGFATFLAVVEP